jgi:hypothetical protein
MRRARWCLLVVAVSCKRPDGPATTPTTKASAGADAEAPPSPTTATEPGKPVCPKPYTGTPGTCTYEVEGCCHPDAEQACRAAGCTTGSCEILETHPAQVRCRETGATP